MNTQTSIGSWLAAGLSVAALILSLYAVTHLGGTHKTAQFGTTFLSGQVETDPFIFLNGIAVGSSQQTTFDGNGKLSIGSSGTALSNVVVNSCSMIANNSIAATSSGYAYCTGVTGVTSADFVQAMFGTSTLGFSQTNDAWEVMTAKASTTPGAIDFELYNNTGATHIPSAVSRTASTTNIIAGH